MEIFLIIVAALILWRPILLVIAFVFGTILGGLYSLSCLIDPVKVKK